VLRKLKELRYRTSYSHRSSYYTLEEVADFDDSGLWSYQSVWFSTHGTLLATVEAMVEASELGYFLDELDNAMHVGTKDAVRKLVRDGRLGREKVGGRYLKAVRGRSTGAVRCWRARCTPNAPWAVHSRLRLHRPSYAPFATP